MVPEVLGVDGERQPDHEHDEEYPESCMHLRAHVYVASFRASVHALSFTRETVKLRLEASKETSLLICMCCSPEKVSILTDTAWKLRKPRPGMLASAYNHKI